MEKRAKNILGHKSPSEFFSNKTQKIFQILVLGLGSPTKCMSIWGYFVILVESQLTTFKPQALLSHKYMLAIGVQMSFWAAFFSFLYPRVLYDF